MFPTLPVVDADAWKQRHPDYDPKNPGPVHEWSVAQALAECLEAIATGCPGFVYDTTGGSIDRVRKVTEAAQAAGYTIVVVRVWTLRPVAWQRNAKRARTVGSEAFHRTHDKVARVWGQLRSLGHVVRNVASHDPHEAPMLAR
jgi:predicted kinase